MMLCTRRILPRHAVGHSWIRTTVASELLWSRSGFRYSTKYPSTSSAKSDRLLALVSQSNGLQHGNTVYSVIQQSNQKPEKSKTASGHEPFHVASIHEQVWIDRDETQAIPHASTSVQTIADRAIAFLSDLFLPRDFRKAVTPDYFPYMQWYFVGAIASSASGVLSMQSLLYAIGLGAGSIPTAAAVNWVLKDGLGQFGGVMFASLVNNRYDADPKRWRIVSALSLDVAVLIEILTPLCPAYFLPMASIANVGKNISWLSASATRAGFHNSFALRENLADITAKAGSQSIASSIIGTGLGIAISSFTGASTMNVLGAFAVLSTIHLVSVHKAMTSVGLRTLNTQRLHLVLEHFLSSPDRTVPNQELVGEQEQILPTLFSGYKSLYNKSFIDGEAKLGTLANNSHDLLRLRELFHDEKYMLNVARVSSDVYKIDIALNEKATSLDTLYAHLHAVLIQRRLEQSQNSSVDPDTVSRECYETSKQIGEQFIQRLTDSDWHTENLLVEEKGMRYKWLID